jgi:hypothetical protein
MDATITLCSVYVFWMQTPEEVAAEGFTEAVLP